MMSFIESIVLASGSMECAYIKKKPTSSERTPLLGEKTQCKYLYLSNLYY